jgi:hypothetical protein
LDCGDGMIQQQIEFFWPLTEQIPLDLDFSQCSPHEYYLRVQGIGRVGPYPTGMVYKEATWTTNNAPQLTVTPIDSVGQLSIGGINVGLETEPKWYQKLLYKALGFKWKDK